MKLIKRLIIVVLILAIVAGVGISLYLDAIVRGQVERSAADSMGVPTELENADLRIFAGEFGMNGLHVANPQGFDSDHFLTLGGGEISVTLGTLMEDTVVLPTLHLNDVDIIIERNGGTSNLDVIMENVGSTEDPDAAPGKKFMVNEVLVKNVRVSVIMPPVSTAAKPLVVEVPEVRLVDVGSDTGNGVVLSQLTGTIVATTVRTVVMNAPDVFGNVVVGSVQGALDKAGDLGKVGGEILGEATQIAGEAAKVIEGATKQGQEALEKIREGGDPGKILEDLGGGVEETTKGIGDAVKGIGNLIPKKDEPKEDE